MIWVGVKRTKRKVESTEEVEGGERQGLMEGEEKMEEKREVEEETAEEEDR